MGFRLLIFVAAIVVMVLLAGFAFPTGDDTANAAKSGDMNISEIK